MLRLLLTILLVCLTIDPAKAQPQLVLTDEFKSITDELKLKPGKTPSSLQIPLYLLASTRRYLGDWDAIALENNYDPNSKEVLPLLLSVEPLIGENSFQWTKKISLGFDRRMTLFNVDVPRPKPNNVNIYGVFVCRDGQEVGRCKNKHYEDIMDIFKRYVSIDGSSIAPISSLPADLIYYFSVFIVYEDSLYVYKAFPTRDKDIELFGKIIRDSAPHRDVLSAVKFIQDRLDTLQSIPGSIKRLPVPISSQGKITPFAYWVDLPKRLSRP